MTVDELVNLLSKHLEDGLDGETEVFVIDSYCSFSHIRDVFLQARPQYTSPPFNVGGDEMLLIDF